MLYPALPLLLAKFWYIDAPIGILNYFGSLNGSFLRMFSFSILLRTFFQPIKNEYRQGLVGFSIGMGIAIKSMVMGFALSLFIVILICELIFLVSFIMLPAFSLLLLFINI